MKHIITDHFRRYTVAYFVALGYATLASLGAFIDIFSGLTREQAHSLPWWGHLALAAKCLTPGIAAILAFMNQTLSRVPPTGVGAPPIISKP